MSTLTEALEAAAEAIAAAEADAAGTTPPPPPAGYSCTLAGPTLNEDGSITVGITLIPEAVASPPPVTGEPPVAGEAANTPGVPPGQVPAV